MTTTTRQNNLILNQDWTRIYQTFKNADFKSYDFENIRRVIISYMRENYPEDFNDYIESSEYLALIDALAFLGQSLSFRIDLASRENFIELAERKESVLRLARMLSYNAKRNNAASGLLKFTGVSTTESILDSNGKNLANQVVSWNDPTNTNWLEQFILILNAAMSENTEFGRSQGSAIVQGILTEQYRFNSASTDVPIYTYSKTVAARGMTFEVVSTAFKGSEVPYEEPPVPANQLGFIYRNDGAGPASPNTGFFVMFKQGSLELADFTISIPTTNEKISVDSANINNEDVWLFKLASDGTQLSQWSRVENLIGSNIVYNSISQNVRDIYSVITRTDDKIDLQFADGIYGNLPQGPFRVYYRVSNGLSYNISPSEMRGITVSVPYRNKQGALHTISVNLALQSTISNAAASETIDDIRTNAPASYYTQNRMITGEDYNLAPLVSSQDILKVKAVNRTSSGISRNFEIIDASGKYSSVNVFADDGYIYKEETERTLSFKYTNRLDIINFIRRNIEAVFTDTDVFNFYLTNYEKILFTESNTIWEQVTTDINLTTGYFKNSVDNSLLKAGLAYATSNLKYVASESIIKFVPPAGYSFKNGQLVVTDINDPEQRDRIWTKIIKITGDGTNAGKGILNSGLGPIFLSDTVPTGAIARQIIPKFVSDLPIDLETEIVNQVAQNLNFGLRYNIADLSWKIITAANLNLTDNWNIGKAGDTTNANLDASWIIAFVREADRYNVRIRGIDYIFGSVEQNRFYLDVNQKAYNDRAGFVVKDQIRILGINTAYDLLTPLNQTISFEITDTIKFDDGYESAVEIKLSFSDADDDGVIDNPDAFEQIAGDDITAQQESNYLFFKELTDDLGNTSYDLVDTAVTPIYVRQTESLIDITEFNDGDLIYFYDSAEDRVKRVDLASNTLVLQSDYKANIGRAGIKFQYLHNASVDRRIDPSSSNIMDVSIITRAYDTAYRIWLAGGTTVEPEAPSSEELRIAFGSKLNSIKAVSDEIIFHPVKYKVLFGTKASEKLQAMFKVVKNPNKSINDNDLKVRIITAINTFFDINNWDFGDRFYLSELTTYVLNSVAPDISNIVIVPKQATQVFGSLFEIQSSHDEILISGATVDDIEIVSAITATEVRASASTIVSTT